MCGWKLSKKCWPDLCHCQEDSVTGMDSNELAWQPLTSILPPCLEYVARYRGYGFERSLYSSSIVADLSEGQTLSDQVCYDSFEVTLNRARIFSLHKLHPDVIISFGTCKESCFIFFQTSFPKARIILGCYLLGKCLH